MKDDLKIVAISLAITLGILLFVAFGCVIGPVVIMWVEYISKYVLAHFGPPWR